MPAYDLGNKVYVSQSSQIQKFVDSINVDSVCNATVACSGKLVPVEVYDFGLGGALKIKFQCSGCGLRGKIFMSSALDIPGNRYRFSVRGCTTSSINLFGLHVCSLFSNAVLVFGDKYGERAYVF